MLLTAGGPEGGDPTGSAHARSMLAAAMASMPHVSVLVFDRDLRYQAVFGAAIRRHGYRPESVVGRRAPEVLPPEAWERLRAAYDAALAGRTTTITADSLDGTATYETVFSPVRQGSRIVGGMAASRDVTERRRHEAELAEARDLFEQAFANAPIGVALVAPDGRWLKVNPALCDMTGYDEATLLAGTFQDITHPDDLDADVSLVQDVLAGRLRTYQMEKRYIRSDGGVVWVLLSVSLSRDVHGEPRFFISQVIDISARKDAEAWLRHQASHDALTGLWNRSRMREELDWWFAGSQRYADPAVLLAIDLDGFKAVNDTYGHSAGDVYLRNVATRLQALLRDSDRCARVGGDEFVVLLPHATADEGRRVAERIVEAVAATPAGGVPAGIARASVGVARLGGQRSAQEWLDAADEAMYRAKQAGGDGIAVAGADDVPPP